VAAIGAIMSVVAERVYAAIGFLLMLGGHRLVFLAVNGLFYPETPHIYLYLSLLVGGWFADLLYGRERVRLRRYRGARASQQPPSPQ
jgi:hypothetical protein